jgi:hypothetical protein
LVLLFAFASCLTVLGTITATVSRASVDDQPVAGDCSQATADQILASLGYKPETPTAPIAGQALCGPFLGSGSQAMVVTLSHGVCKPNSGWLVLAFAKGAWKVVFPGDRLFGVMPFTAVGFDFRETLPILLKTDSFCFPTGGSKARVWHWNGTTFVPGRWKRLTVGSEFLAPSRKFGCVMGDHPGARSSAIGGATCVARTHPLTATITLQGRLFFCPQRGQTFCYGSVRRVAPTLAYGQQTTVGRFRCLSLRKGVKCTNVKTGKGFLMNGTRALPVPRRD